MGFARTLPRRAGHRLFAGLGGLAGRILARDRRRAADNLAIAFPTAPLLVREAMVSAMYRNLGRNAYEFLRLEGMSGEDIAHRVDTVIGLEHLQRAYALGRGLLGVTGHIGCWELLPAYFASQGYPVTVIGRRMKDQRLDERLTEIRRSLGVESIDRDAGPRQLLEVLRSGRMMGVLIDQHTRVSGVYVPFFGRPAFTPTGVAKLAIMTGAPIVPLAVFLAPSGRHTIHVLPALPVPDAVSSREEAVRALTERCSLAVEELIRIDPKQWVWFHHRWRAPEEAGQGYAVRS